MNPSSFVDELCMRQMVSDVREPTGVHRYVCGPAFRVIAVLGAAYGLVEIPAAETAVYFNRYAKVFAQRFQDLLAEPD